MISYSAYNVSRSGFLAFSPSRDDRVQAAGRRALPLSRLIIIAAGAAVLLAGAFFYLMELQELRSDNALLARREKEYNTLREENARLASRVREKISPENIDFIRSALSMEKAQARFITSAAPVFVAK